MEGGNAGQGKDRRGRLATTLGARAFQSKGGLTTRRDRRRTDAAARGRDGMGKPQAATVMSGSDLRVVVDCGRRFTGPPRSATTEAPHFTFGARAYWGLLVWGARPGNWGPSRPGGAQRVDRVGGDARCAMGMGNGRAGDGPTDRPMRAVAATLATPGQPRAHLNQFRDGHLRALPGFDPGATHWRVIGVVATLAERQEVGRSAILRLMIQVRDGQNDAAAGGRMRFAMTCIAARAFAAPLRTIAPDRQADLPPVLRIAIPVFRADRHLHRLRLAQALDLGAQAAAVVVQRGDARVLDTDADLQRADLRGLALQQLGGVHRLGRLAQGRGASVGSTAPRARQKIGIRQRVAAQHRCQRPLPERLLRLGHQNGISSSAQRCQRSGCSFSVMLATVQDRLSASTTKNSRPGFARASRSASSRAA